MNETAYEVDIRVTAMDPVTFADLTPLLEDLNERFVSVTATRYNYRPTMAGELDMVLLLAIGYAAGVTGGEFLKKFAGLLAEDAYKAIRNQLRRLRDKADQVADERVWTLTVQIGSHPFHFQGPMDDGEFTRRLRAAQAILDRSPERLITTVQQPHEMEPGWYWRDDHWEATPMLAVWMREDRSP